MLPPRLQHPNQKPPPVQHVQAMVKVPLQLHPQCRKSKVFLPGSKACSVLAMRPKPAQHPLRQRPLNPISANPAAMVAVAGVMGTAPQKTACAITTAKPDAMVTATPMLTPVAAEVSAPSQMALRHAKAVKMAATVAAKTAATVVGTAAMQRPAQKTPQPMPKP